MKIFSEKCLKNIVEKDVKKEIFYNNISIDTRKMAEGDIFIGLKGENFDGNVFAKDISHKASLLILDNKHVYSSIDAPKILVKDTFQALKSIGKYNLENFKNRIVCITGSSGKTTTKKLVSDILSKRYSVFTAYKNFNNEIGASLNAANLDEKSDYAVFEIGSNNIGEIDTLSKYLTPHICIITNIGKAHIGRFKSEKEIAQEKLSLLKNTTLRGYINESCLRYSYLLENIHIPLLTFGESKDNSAVISNINRKGEKIAFDISYKGKNYTFILNHMFKHFVYNAAAAISLCLDEGVSISEIDEALQNFTPEEHRGDIIDCKVIKIIDDTYNCSFDSLILAIKNLSELNGEKKYALIGEMAEIEGFEDEFYEEVIKLAKNIKNVTFAFLGEKYKKFNPSNNVNIFSEKDEFIQFISNISVGTVLLKASRSKKFEDFISYLIKKPNKEEEHAV
jgi:UDP-N-acetylmuramoyl-tripeptide--D-alanyl-D-alanine ligase